MKKIQIGRTAGKNDVVINKPDISNMHCSITQLSDAEYLVEDLDSTNGTWVNGTRIFKQRVGLYDELRLSQNEVVSIAQLFSKPAAPPPSQRTPLDYTKEFTALEDVWESYQKDRNSTTERYEKKKRNTQVLITVIPALIFFGLKFTLFKNLSSELQNDISSSWILVSLLLNYVAATVISNQSILKELQEMDNEFKIRYVCPNSKCYSQFGNTPWKYYKRQKKCMRCNAQYA